MRTFILQNLFIEIIAQHLRHCMVATFIMVNIPIEILALDIRHCIVVTFKTAGGFIKKSS